MISATRHLEPWSRPFLCLLPLLLLVACKSGGQISEMDGARPGETRYFNLKAGVTVAFQWIPAGEYTMGSPESEFGRSDYEVQKQMLVHNGFWMSRQEISRAIWHQIMNTEFPPLPRDSNRPIADVDWNDCQKFTKRLDHTEEGWCFALPTESQWEYACRAGSTGAFYGDPAKIAWLDSNSRARSHETAMLPPNRWGLHDMHGNVAEWCRDLAAPGGNNHRIIRGGSWDSDLSARAAARNSDTPRLHSDRLGFRIVLEPQKSLIYQKHHNTNLSQL